MGFYSDPWLREARDKIKSSPPELSATNTGSDADFDRLADAVEKAIKAALVEKHGSIPHTHNHSSLVSLCQTTGIWDVLPPALKNLVQEVESHQSATTGETHGSVVSSSQEQLQRYFSVARRLIDYMEYHVIGNDSVLRRLNVV